MEIKTTTVVTLFMLSFALALSVGPGYNPNYGNAETGYAGNPYPAYYGMNPVSFVIFEMYLEHS